MVSNSEEEEYTVHVKAQVMIRDDSSGGWVPLGGGGVSVVGVRYTEPPPEHVQQRAYSIYGCRMTDQSVSPSWLFSSPVSIQTQSLALRALRKRKPQEMPALVLARAETTVDIRVVLTLFCRAH